MSGINPQVCQMPLSKQPRALCLQNRGPEEPAAQSQRLLFHPAAQGSPHAPDDSTAAAANLVSLPFNLFPPQQVAI
jgi:hypothetical protein